MFVSKRDRFSYRDNYLWHIVISQAHFGYWKGTIFTIFSNESGDLYETPIFVYFLSTYGRNARACGC